MRDRLIELLKFAKSINSERVELQKDEYLYLLELVENSIVPNVEIGTKIYAVPLYPRGVYEFEVADIDKKYVCRGGWVFTDTHLGKTTFLTKEEAEKALAEREGKG